MKKKRRKKDETSPSALFTQESVVKNLKESLETLCGVAIGVLGLHKCRFAIHPKRGAFLLQLVFTAFLTSQRRKGTFHFLVQMVIF